MTKYFTKEQIMRALEEQNLMLDDIWGVEQRLDELQGADVAPVVHAKALNPMDIEYGDISMIVATCSNCGKDMLVDDKYCSNCGARMEGREKQWINA